MFLSEEWQFAFKIKGIAMPLKDTMIEDDILLRGIQATEDSIIYFKVKQTDPDKDKIKDEKLKYLKNLARMYSIITNHYTEVPSGLMIAPVSIQYPFGHKYRELVAVPFLTDIQREENKSLFKKAIEKTDSLEVNSVKNRKYLKNAIDYYNRALGDSSMEERLIDLMICLESLFSKENDELSLRYSLRLSYLIASQRENDLKQVFRVTHELYAKRSKVVHGSEGIDINECDLNYLQTYLRDAIKWFIQIPLKKDNFLMLLDECVVDSDKRRELKEIVSKAVEKW